MLEKFEVEFRTKLAYHLANKYCATSYLRPELFENALHHEDFLKNFWRDKSSQSKSLIVKHHNEKYGGIIPIWAAVEIVSFGTLSKLYCNLNETDRKTFSLEHYEVKEWMLKSWLRSFVECRNICAHYGRLYNRILLSRPRLFNDMTGFNNQRIFPVLYLLARYEEDNATIYSACTRLRTAFTFFPSAECEKIGFPENWFQVITGFDLDSARNTHRTYKYVGKHESGARSGCFRTGYVCGACYNFLWLGSYKYDMCSHIKQIKSEA